ncbi:MAG: hypothetical protein Q4E47_01040 [Candidatus Saccharibacteria bacterium]|nr:hypothetical protein [Candidatus Saccharibacteria bacterium]
MSKASKRTKNSKTGRKQAETKSVEKTEKKMRLKAIEEASTPVEFSLRTDNYGKAPSSFSQLMLFGVGFMLLTFSIIFSISIISDFVSAANDGYSIVDYFQTCEPAVMCRTIDVLEILAILFAFIGSIIPLKIFFTNRYSHRKTLWFFVICVVLATISYAVSFVLNRVLLGI